MSTNPESLRVIFETHATSVDNETGLASGWADAPLSAVGEALARTLGQRRADDDLAAVYCSDLQRSWRTAETAFARRGLPIHRDARLRECDYGTLTRRPLPEIEIRRAAQIATAFPGGESYAQVAHRVGEWLADVRPRFAGATILVIGHRGTFYALQHLLAGVPIVDAIAAPWHWQPGWVYEVSAR